MGLEMTRYDYYDILGVDPKAEQDEIWAACSRILEQNFPEISTSPEARQQIDDALRARTVLTNPARRKEYDAGGERPPDPPLPAAYGIEPGYLERAVEGARIWKMRKPTVPERGKWTLRAACITLGVTACLATVDGSVRGQQIAVYAIASFLVAEVPIRVIEAMRDRHFHRTVLGPKYNPNPDGYNKYAVAYAKYETEISTVYISRNFIAHSNRYCSRMMSYTQRPNWEVDKVGTRRCCKCGHFTVRPKLLPPPFGTGHLPTEPD